CWHRGGNSACSGADLTNDQNVDFSDFKILADTWLQSSDSGYTTEASGLSITSLWHGREVTVPANR
ncbi:MAG: hypothetical protein ACYS74_14255, partial [Planctomycetota bacterium]